MSDTFTAERTVAAVELRLTLNNLRRLWAAAFFVIPAVLVAFVSTFDRASDAVPSGDQSADLAWAHQALPPQGLVMHGHFSRIGLPHPGPFYLWVLSLGQKAAHVFGANPSFGATVAYLVVWAWLVIAGATAFSFAAEKAWPGVIYLVSFVALSWSTLYMSASNLSTAAWGLAGAGVFSIACKKRWAGGCLALAGTLMVQLFLETVVIGAVALLVAFLATRHGATSWAKRITWASVAFTLLVVVARFIEEGPGVIQAYLSAAATTRRSAGGSIGEVLFHDLGAYVSVPVPLFWLAVAAFVLLAVWSLVKKTNRRIAISGLVCVFSVLLYAVFIPIIHDRPQMFPIVLVLPFVLVHAPFLLGKRWLRPLFAAPLLVSALWAPSPFYSALWLAPGQVPLSMENIDVPIERGAEVVVEINTEMSRRVGSIAWPLALWLSEHGYHPCIGGLSKHREVPEEFLCMGKTGDVLLSVVAKDDPQAALAEKVLVPEMVAIRGAVLVVSTVAEGYVPPPLKQEPGGD